MSLSFIVVTIALALVPHTRPGTALATAKVHASFGRIHATAAYGRAALHGLVHFGRRSGSLGILQLPRITVSNARVVPWIVENGGHAAHISNIAPKELVLP